MNARRRTTVLATAALGSGLVLGGLQVPAEAAPAKPKVSLRATSVQEGTGRAVVARVPAVLDRKARRDVVVRWRTVAGSATAGQDFRPARGKVVVRKGKKRAVIRVRVVGDARVEGTERFRVKVVRARGAAVAKRVARVRITDDDRRSTSGGGGGSTSGPGTGQPGGGDGGPVDAVLPLLGLGGLLPTFVDAWSGDSLPVPLSLDEVAAGDVTGVLTGTLTTPSGDVALPGVPFTIPAGSLSPTDLPELPLPDVPSDASSLTLTVVGLTGARPGDLTRVLPLLDPAVLPELSLGSLTGLLGGTLPVPLTLDRPAPVDVVGVLTSSYTLPLGGLGGLGDPLTVPLPSVPFTIPAGSTSPVGGLLLPLSSLPLGVSTLTVTVTQLSGAWPSGPLTRTMSLL